MIGVDFVDSTMALRLWRTCKEAGRPWPVLDDDDVIDYMIMEAVAVKSTKVEQEAQKREEQKAWKKDDEGLKGLKSIAGG